MPTNKKIAYIFLTTSIIYSLIVFNGIIDDFSPFSITEVEKISESSHLDQSNHATNQVPGFFALGAVIKLISNISSIGFLTYPLQLLSLLTVFYLFTLKISNSPIFSGAATFLYICSGTTGTGNIFFWPHGMGSIVYWVALFLTYSILLIPSYKKIEYTLLLNICGCSLVFLSYNYYLNFILVLFTVVLIVWIVQKNKMIKFDNINYKILLNSSLIFIIAELGLSNFVYETFLPMLIMTSDLVKISAVDKFLSAYIYRRPSPEVSVISELLLGYPRIITIISALKYLIIVVSVVFFVFLCLYKIHKKSGLSILDLFMLSFLIPKLIYILIRAYIGDIAITDMFLPGVFCIIWLYKYANVNRKWIKFAIVVILILTPLYTYYIEINDLRNQPVYENEYLKASSNWYFENKGNDIGVSDEMTRDLMSMFIFEKYHYPIEIKILPQDDAGFLVQKLDLSNSQKYYVINYHLRRMSLQNWVIIKSWSFFENSIDSNKRICKIYDLDSVSIYY